MAFLEFIISNPSLIASPLISVFTNQTIKGFQDNSDLTKELTKVKNKTLKSYKAWGVRERAEQRVGDIGKSIIDSLQGGQIQLDSDQLSFLKSFEENLWKSDAWRYLFGKRMDAKFETLELQIDRILQKSNESLDTSPIYDLVLEWLKGIADVKEHVDLRTDEIKKSIDELHRIRQSDIRAAIDKHISIYDRRFSKSGLNELYVEPMCNTIHDGIVAISSAPLFDILHQKDASRFSNEISNCYSPDVWLFSGEPGVGKTSSILKFISDVGTSDKAIVVIELHKSKNYLSTKNEIEKLILDTLGLSINSLEDLNLIYVETIIIFDGLDEFNMSNVEHRLAIMELKKGIEDFIELSNLRAKIFVFGRPQSINTFKLENSITTEILPLVDLHYAFKGSNDGVTDLRYQYLVNYGLNYDDKLEEFITCNPSANQFPITNYPLLLSQLLKVYKAANTELRTQLLNTDEKYDLYYVLSKFYFEREEYKSRGKNRRLRELLDIYSKLAHTGWINGEVKNIPLGKLTEYSETEIEEIATRHYLSLKDECWIEFSHKSFGEFFAARHFIEKFKKLFGEEMSYNNRLIEFYYLFSDQSMTEDQSEWIISGIITELKDGNAKALDEFTNFFETTYQFKFGPDPELYSILGGNENLSSHGINNTLLGITSIVIGLMRFRKTYLGKLFDGQFNFLAKWSHWSNSKEVSIWEVLKKDMQYANLGFVVVTRENIRNARFIDSTLASANFSESNLMYSEFMNANLENVNFSACELEQVQFTNANLDGANLSFANLLGADLSHANLSNAILLDCDLSRANFQDVKNLNAYQLSVVTSIQDALNLDESLLEEVLKYPNAKESLRNEIKEIRNKMT